MKRYTIRPSSEGGHEAPSIRRIVAYVERRVGSEGAQKLAALAVNPAALHITDFLNPTAYIKTHQTRQKRDRSLVAMDSSGLLRSAKALSSAVGLDSA